MINYLPVIGPVIDIAGMSNTKRLKAWEFPVSMFLPIFGPAIVSNKGTQICLYNSLLIKPAPGVRIFRPDEDRVDPTITNIAIATSNENCANYQDLVFSTFGAIGIDSSVINKLAGNGAAIAGAAGTAGGAAGLAAAGQFFSSGEESIKNFFFQNATLPQLFSSITATRNNLLGGLYSNPGLNINRNDYWDYNRAGLPYAKFLEFINALDNTCSLTQGSIALGNAVAQGNKDASKGTEQTETPSTQNASGKDKGKETHASTGAKTSTSTEISPFIERSMLIGVPFQ
jgi:hypothetical protein